MKINVIGNVLGQSGYDRHTRGLAQGLHNVGVDVRLDFQKPLGWETLVSDSELVNAKKEFDPDSTTIMITQPQFWPLGLSEKPKQFGGFAVWEGNVCPESWLEYMADNRVNYIFVPSNHTKEAILNTIKKYKKENEK